MESKTRSRLFYFTIFLLIGTAYSIMWHYKTGEFIVQNGFVTKKDVFSWQENLNWMCHEWLYDVGLYLLYSKFGERAIKLLPGFAMLIPLLVSFYYNRKNIKNSLLYIVFLTVLIAYWNSSNCARPSEFSIGIMLIMAIQLIENSKWKYISSLLLSILCVNIHGGSIAQLLVIPVLFIISDLLVALVKRESEKKNIIEHLICLVLMVFGSLINPYGAQIYKYTLNIFMGAKYINSHIQEWKPMVIQMIPAIVILGSCLCMGANEKFKEFDKNTIRKIILICGFLCEGMLTIRMFFNASCILMVFGYEYIEDYLIRLYDKIKPKTKKYNLRIPTKVKYIFIDSFLIIIFLTSTTFLLLYGRSSDPNKTLLMAVDEKDPYMKEVTDYIKENNMDGRLFNAYGDGGPLILHDIKTFVDPRCDPFMEEFSSGNTSMYDYCVASDAKKTTKYLAWKEMQDKYKFDYGIFNKSMAVDRELIESLKLRENEVLVDNEGYTLINLTKEK